jgi:hypothetical protein
LIIHPPAFGGTSELRQDFRGLRPADLLAIDHEFKITRKSFSPWRYRIGGFRIEANPSAGRQSGEADFAVMERHAFRHPRQRQCQLSRLRGASESMAMIGVRGKMPCLFRPDAVQDQRVVCFEAEPTCCVSHSSPDHHAGQPWVFRRGQDRFDLGAGEAAPFFVIDDDGSFAREYAERQQEITADQAPHRRDPRLIIVWKSG